jgi:hypothetical protein
MPRFYEPDLSTDPNSPFVRDAANKLVRRTPSSQLSLTTLAPASPQGFTDKYLFAPIIIALNVALPSFAIVSNCDAQVERMRRYERVHSPIKL